MSKQHPGRTPRTIEKAIECFWSFVCIKGPNECWLFKGHLNATGYGQFRGHTQRMEKAHRHAYSITIGNIPEGMHVLHTCDVRNCVNPNHLFLGTNVDNVKDKISKGRQCVGAATAAAKLTNKQVRAIVCKWCKGQSHRKLAACFGVSHTAIRMIVSGKTWQHITTPLGILPTPLRQKNWQGV